MDASKSGLVKYLFGDDLSGEVTRADFTDLQNRLIDDVLTLEYTRYCPKEEKMSEVAGFHFIYYFANLGSIYLTRVCEKNFTTLFCELFHLLKGKPDVTWGNEWNSTRV